METYCLVSQKFDDVTVIVYPGTTLLGLKPPIVSSSGSKVGGYGPVSCEVQPSGTGETSMLYVKGSTVLSSACLFMDRLTSPSAALAISQAVFALSVPTRSITGFFASCLISITFATGQ